MTDWVFLTHLAATGWMIGLIWFVQVVHYPLFSLVGSAQSVEYARVHQRLTTWVVAPVMLAELVSGAWLLWDRPPAMPLGWVFLGLVLIGIVWVSTAMLQVPCHRKLSKGFDARVHRRLVISNWLRTGAWSARGVMLLTVLGQTL